MSAYQQLKTIFRRIHHLQSIQQTLFWDEAVMLPKGAGAARGKAMGTLSRTIQKMLTQKNIQAKIDAAKADNSLALWDQANLKWMAKNYLSATAIPIKLIGQFTEATMATEQLWRQMRPLNNWQDFYPALQKSFQLTQEIAERKSQLLAISPYDAMLDNYVPGFKQQDIDQVFAGLKAKMPTLIKKIVDKQTSQSQQKLSGHFPIENQTRFARKMAEALGFDFTHGRIDVSHHPFCSGNGYDTRITTRYDEKDFVSSLLAVCHETGHGLYEQGLPKKWLDQPVGRVESMAMHESQSLLIEMELCRSKEFLAYVAPLANVEFGTDMTATTLYQHVTKVSPSLIRVEADEVTYPMHVILRYELEKELFNGDIKVVDLPKRWQELMRDYLNVDTENNYRDGVMQDMHWPGGAFGYFPAYTLGRMIAAQLFIGFLTSEPNFFAEVKQGNFQALHRWLEENVYCHASSLGTHELVEKVTKQRLSADAFIRRIEERYL